MRYIRNERVNPPTMVRELARRTSPRVAGVIPFGDATEEPPEGGALVQPTPGKLVETVSHPDTLPTVLGERGKRKHPLDHGNDLLGLTDDDHFLYYRHDGLRALTGDMALGAATRNFLYNGNNAFQVQANANAAQYLVFQTSTAGFAPRITVDGTGSNIDLKISPKGTGNVIITNLEFAGTAPSFAGAQHDHENAAGGGTLDHTAALTNVGSHTHAEISSHLAFFQGTFLESFDALVIEDAGDVKMTLERSDGGDLTMVFSDGHTILDCTPIINITLTEGVDAANPKKNYVYILQSGKVLASSTTGWPDTEHIKVGFFLIQTDIEVAARGALINQNWNDHPADTAGSGVGQGHLTHITERTRRLGAVWLSGTEGVATQDGNDLWVSIASGVVSQLHPHSFAALDSDTAGAGDAILVVNDPDSAYTVINSLNAITKHSNGDAIGNNKYVKFVVWAAANKSGQLSPIMLNLPSEHYNTAAEAATDVEGYANFTIPANFKTESTTGFLVAAFVCQHTATAMLIDTTIDQRGNTPSTATGAGTGGGDVTAAAVIADHAIVRGDGGAKGIQTSGVLIDDSDNITMAGDFNMANNDILAPLFIRDVLGNPQAYFPFTPVAVNYLSLQNTVSGTGAYLATLGDDADIDLNLNPKGTGVVNVLGNITLTGTVDGRDVAADGAVLDTAAIGAATFTDNAVICGDGGSRGVQDRNVFISDDGRLGIVTDDVAQYGANTWLALHREGGSCGYVIAIESNTAGNQPTMQFRRARGTEGTKLAVQSGDSLGAFLCAGWDGAAFDFPAEILFQVDGAVTSVPSVVPTSIIFKAGAPVRTERLRIQSDGDILIDTDSKLMFRDPNLFVQSSANGQLDIDADTTVQVTAPTIDLVASTSVTISDYLTVGLKADATRGAAGTAGRVIFNTDDGQLNIDDGANWTLPDGTAT